LFPGRTRTLADDAATRARVGEALPAHRWAHFACHAVSDLTDPSASHLLLAGGTDRQLTVLDLARLRLEDAELAYLSACATARTGPRLADEAIQLASAFQIAGYRNVVATLWPVVDRLAYQFAVGVYATLATSGAQATATAVHAAAHAGRNLVPGAPSTWAAHVHSGA
jgi:CHAT domain-containing protein